MHPNAHREVIKRAYRTIISMLQAHPDLGGSHDDAVRVNEAYKVLSHEETRKAYDAARARRRGAAQTTEAAMAAAAYAANRAHHAGSGARESAPRGGTRQQAPRKAGGPVQTVFCPRCGTRNRLPLTAKARFAICGKCRSPLQISPQSSHEPMWFPENMALNATLTSRLAVQGEIRLKRAQMPADHALRCLRCRWVWVERGERLPAICPHCRSPRWSEFRVFRCRCCSHQFMTTNLASWPYWLFSECPACHQKQWHPGCEKHPLRWILNVIRFG